MLEFFKGLFATDFSPHAACIRKPEVIWLDAASDFGIALAYLLIPIALIYFVRKRRDLEFSGIFWLFGVFILSCGTTHVLGIVTLWYPVYRLDAVVRAITAISSLATAVVLIRSVPLALQLASPAQLRAEIAERAKAESEVRRLNEELERRVAERTAELERANENLTKMNQDLMEADEAFNNQLTLITTITDNARTALFIVDDQQHCAYLNPAAEQLTGYTLPELRGKKLHDVLHCTHPDGSNFPAEQCVLHNAATRARNGERISGEEIFIHKNGKAYDIAFTVSRVDENAGISGAIIEIEDVTERKERERKRIQVERLLDAVLDSIPVAIIIADPGGTLVRFNRASALIWGRTAPMSAGIDRYGEWVGYFPDTGRPVQAHEWPLARALMTGDEITGELLEIQRFDDHKHLFVELSAAPVRDTETGAVLGAVVAALDVTEQRTAVQKMRAREEEFRTLANGIPQLCWMANADGFIFWYNDRWYEYTGTTPAEMEGWGWQSVHDPDVLPAVMEGWQSALHKGELFEMVFPLRSASGSFRQFLTRVIPVRDASGKIVRWFGTNTDITEQKRTEEDLRRANQDLEQFAFSASHDLQEPLRNISIYSQMILRALGSSSDANIKESLGYLVEGSRRAGTLIRDLLTYTQAGDLRRGEPVRVSAESVLATVIADMKQRIEETDASVTCDRLPDVLMQEAHLRQLFQNLLSNAIKYRKDGVGPVIHVSATRQDRMVRFTVQDNGIGIEPDYRERIFGLFKRLHGRTERYPGTGIGLAICQKIVERYGGRIWVDSEFGSGSSFHFLLPPA